MASKHLRTGQRLLPLLLVVLLLSGCGLFNRAANQRESENAAVTNGLDLGNVVTAEGVGQNNEPVGETDSFSSSQDYIYVVAEADYIEEGTTLFARWSREGEPFEDSSELTADQDYKDTYIEFHLENLQSRFESGDYSVQLFANGNPVEEVKFSVD